MKRVKKCLTILLLTLLLLVLCTLLLGYFLLGTDKGFNITASELEKRVEGLTFGSVEGNLKSGIKSDLINFHNEQVNIQASGIESKWRIKCLIDKTLCIDSIVLDKLNVELFASESNKPESDNNNDISLPDITLPVSFNARQIEIKKLKLKPPGDAPIQELQNIRLSAHSDQHTLNVVELSSQYKNITVSSSGSIKPTGPYPIDLDIDVQATDFLDEFDAHTSIKISNTINELDINVLLTGALNADITGRINPLRKELPAKLDIKTKQAGWPLDTNQLAQVNDLSLTIDGDMDDYRVKLQTLVKGQNIPETELDLVGVSNLNRALVTNFSALTLGGFATGNAAVTWQDGITWVSKVIAKDIDPSIKFDGVAGKLNGSLHASGDLADGKWTLNLQKAQVDGVLRDVPFQLNTKLVKHANDTWQLDSLVLNNGRNRINANGQLSNKWDLNAVVNLPELQNLLPDLNGGFNAVVDLSGELENPDIKIKANSDTVKFNDISIAGLSLNANIKRGALDNSELALSVTKVQTGEQNVSNVKLKLDGSLQKHTVALFADGPHKTSIDLLTVGGLNDDFDWNGVLKKVKLEVPAPEINLREPTELAWINSTKKFSIEPHCWSIQESNVCLKNQVLAQNDGQALIALDAYRLEQLNPFLPAESNLRGKLKADLTIDWGKAFEGGFAAKLDASIDSDSMGQAQIDLTLDSTSEKKNIDGKVDLSGFKIGFLKAFLPDYDDISGEISAKGKLSGELLDPLYYGDVVLSSLIVRSAKLPVSIDGGKLTATINGKRTELNGQFKSGDGNIGISGSANWLQESYRADIKVNAKKLNVVQEPLSSSTVNAKLTISAKPDRIRIRGNVDVPTAAINIKELPRGAATLSDDVIVVEDVYAQTQKKQQKKAPAAYVDVKVNVSLGDSVTLAGYGLNASLTGDLSLSQSGPNPTQLTGEVTIVSGIYKQYGQDLQISNGQVLFVGPIDQTTLNIDAIRTIDAGDRIAGLHLEGRIEDPEVSLFTEPADKTQESILSFIVLGRDIGDNSNRDKSLLASAALALTLKGGNAITDNLAESLGIQEISLDTRSRDDTTELVVSGQINDRHLKAIDLVYSFSF